MATTAGGKGARRGVVLQVATGVVTAVGDGMRQCLQQPQPQLQSCLQPQPQPQVAVGGEVMSLQQHLPVAGMVPRSV